MSQAELTAAIESFDDQGLLVVNDTTLRVVKFIKRPPLSRTARFAYAFLFQAAVASMPKKYRDRLGLKSLPLWLIQPVTKGLLGLMRLAIGDHSPIEEAALERHARIGQSAQ
jgi:hypothetical protein